MTIKQRGGVFGRNPKYNNVEAENLDVKGTSTFEDIVEIKRTTPLIYLIETDTTDVNTRIRNAAGNFQISTANDALNSYDARINIDHSTGEVTVYDNLVIGTSGKGIDFSATAGTGTSELFDDYEEGTWTPNLQGYGGTPTTSGIYTKIGDCIIAEASIQLDGTADASGFVVTNPPFAANTNYIGGGVITKNTGGTADILINQSATGLFRLRTSSDAAISYDTVGASATIQMTLTYKAA